MLELVIKRKISLKIKIFDSKVLKNVILSVHVLPWHVLTGTVQRIIQMNTNAATGYSCIKYNVLV